MGFIITVLQSLLAFFPTWFVAVLFSLFAIVIIVVIVKVVGFVLDAIPFL